MIKVIRIGPTTAGLLDVEFGKTPEAFMAVTHPQCGHCKDMEPDLNTLFETLENNYQGNVGVFDIHAEAIPNTNITALKSIDGYPTIMAVKNNKPIHYNGNRSAADLLNFCLKH